MECLETKNVEKEGGMAEEQAETLDMFCTAREMKERKRELYENAMNACPDQVGIETFRILRDAEADHLKRIQEVYEELKKGKVSADVCHFHSFDTEDKKVLLRRVAAERGKVPSACLDDVAAIETGIELENACIDYFEKQLKQAADPIEREFLQRMIADDREHHILLADLKFYYVDTENWFLEKGRQILDGAGGGA
jgi:rubrerythrin